jgi:Zeta toxin
MGVGKGYVLVQLKQIQVLDFATDDYIKIDPDMIKTELPEMAGYDYALAATMLHAESSQMADVLLEHGLVHSLNMIVDGSLRNVSYYQQLLQRIRREFPLYRIAILHVTAHPDMIRSRAQNRSGRAVPAALVEESIRQVPHTRSKL